MLNTPFEPLLDEEFRQLVAGGSAIPCQQGASLFVSKWRDGPGNRRGRIPARPSRAGFQDGGPTLCGGCEHPSDPEFATVTVGRSTDERSDGPLRLSRGLRSPKGNSRVAQESTPSNVDRGIDKGTREILCARTSRTRGARPSDSEQTVAFRLQRCPLPRSTPDVGFPSPWPAAGTAGVVPRGIAPRGGSRGDGPSARGPVVSYGADDECR